MIKLSDSSKTSLILLAFSLVIFSSVSRLEANSTGLVPLTELGSDMYMGYEGGLYPDGSNDIPAAHSSKFSISWGFRASLKITGPGELL